MTFQRFHVVCVSNKAYLAFDSEGTPQAPDEDNKLSTSLTVGKVYEVVGEDLGMYAIVDDTGEEYLFPKNRFRRIE
jgi:hypothetical protein